MFCGIGAVLSILKLGLGWMQQRSADAKNFALKQMQNRTDNRNTSAALMKVAMSHKVFWFVWAMFAIPLGLWWDLVIIDSMIQAQYLDMGIPDLPITVKPWAGRIFDSLFLSGAGMGGVQVASRGIAASVATWTSSRGNNPSQNEQKISDKRDIMK